MPTDTRSAVADVIRELSAESADTDTGTAEPIEPAGESGVEVEAAAEPEADRSSPGRDRDDKGRFAKGQKEPAAPVRAEPKTDAAAGQGPADGAPPLAAAPALPELKAPQDWRAAARDKWGTVPREAQEEAIRLHVETKKAMERAAALEKESGGWKEPLAPYEPMARRYGVPLQHLAAETLRLRDIIENAPAQMSAQAIVQVFRNRHGSDEAAMKLLADAWHGVPEQGQARPQSQGPEQIAQLVRQQLENERFEQGRQAALNDWKTFETSADLLNEPGIRPSMKALLGMWLEEHPREQPTAAVFKEIYDQACRLNEGAAKILNQRKEAAAAKAKASTSGAAAASGVKNEPAGPSNATGPAKDTREEVARQMKRARQARV